MNAHDTNGDQMIYEVTLVVLVEHIAIKEVMRKKTDGDMYVYTPHK